MWDGGEQERKVGKEGIFMAMKQVISIYTAFDFVDFQQPLSIGLLIHSFNKHSELHRMCQVGVVQGTKKEDPFPQELPF